ncbi:hypothetical protein PV370_13745 [Streptomyces sp. NE06-03C]|nr:hypothetical protein [Streptomyces sp. NE06-03C]MDX2919016.1 hypothetical protein [Streptomyces sp. NE06-03C]
MPGQVTAVSRNERYSFSKPNRDSIRLLTGLGVEGDVHAGETIRHQFRMTYEPNLPNLRQVHLMHEELFDELALKGSVRPDDSIQVEPPPPPHRPLERV